MREIFLTFRDDLSHGVRFSCLVVGRLLGRSGGFELYLASLSGTLADLLDGSRAFLSRMEKMGSSVQITTAGSDRVFQISVVSRTGFLIYPDVFGSQTFQSSMWWTRTFLVPKRPIVQSFIVVLKHLSDCFN